MSHKVSYILLPDEVIGYVQNLEPSKMEDFGTISWFGVHEQLQKLHQQAVLEVGALREESVKEAFVSYSKISYLVHEAICVSVWKEKVFYLLLQTEKKPKNTFVPYMILYHEVTAVGLLEVTLFHPDTCEALEDSAIDLIDYCAFAVVRLESLTENAKWDENALNRNAVEELKYQQIELAFDIGFRSISILQQIADNLERLPLSATSRMFVTHDVPMLFKNLIQKTPWCRKNDKGQTLKHIDGKWQVMQGEDRMKLTRTEGLVWLGLRQLLLDPRCAAHYEMSDYRKNQLVQLQGYLHDVLLDQLAPLVTFKHWLSQLAMSNPPAKSKRPIVVEVVPEIRQSLLNRTKKQWKYLAKQHEELFFNMTQDHMLTVAKRLSDTYNLDTLNALSAEVPKCVGCGEPAAKRCSRCKTHWYCGRECQVKNWRKHKVICDRLAEVLEKYPEVQEQD